MHRRILVAVLLGASAGGAALAMSACRQEEPAGDPKTPPNSPLPEIDKKDNDPKTGPKLPSLRDAG
jgi:hypothetical protein